MKTLILLRHGKAEPLCFEKDDFYRLLEQRGRKNATDMGKHILQQSGIPDLIIASGATRTTETAKLVAESLSYPIENINLHDGLYLISSRKMLQFINSLSNDLEHCLLVGHNPGITDLVNDFGVRLDNLPTGSAVCFTFKIEKWEELNKQNALFQWIKLAKEL